MWAPRITLSQLKIRSLIIPSSRRAAPVKRWCVQYLIQLDNGWVRAQGQSYKKGSGVAFPLAAARNVFASRLATDGLHTDHAE